MPKISAARTGRASMSPTDGQLSHRSSLVRDAKDDGEIALRRALKYGIDAVDDSLAVVSVVVLARVGCCSPALLYKLHREKKITMRRQGIRKLVVPFGAALRFLMGDEA